MELAKVSSSEMMPTQKDIDDLKSQLDAHKRKSEYEQLKQDLMDISIKSKYELSEFDGGLKEVDTQRILKTQNKKTYLADFIVQGFLKMASPRPVARNLLAIGLLISTVFCIVTFLHIKQFEAYKIYFCYFLEAAIGVQILKSSSRSLFIPVIALTIGVIASNIMMPNQLFLAHHQLYYQILMIIGALGITISVFTID